MTTVLQADLLDGRIRYALRRAEQRAEALQHEILHPIDAQALEMAREQVEAVMRSADTRTFPADARTTGAILERILVPPELRQMLEAVQGALLVSTSLVGIPWELLHDGESFWGTRFALGRQLVSRQSFTFRADSRRPARRRALVIGADPDGSLPKLAAEVEGLCTSLAARLDVVCLAGPIATAAAIVEQLRDGFDLIHFCGHTVDDASAAPALLAADGRPVTASLIHATTAGRPLVVLNACSSAAAPGAAAPRERTAWGIADAFLHAGATGVVGTSRDVVDGSALEFSRRFYASVLDGVPVGEALRQCRQHALTNLRPDVHPTWLAFVLYGNPELALAEASTASGGWSERPATAHVRGRVSTYDTDPGDGRVPTAAVPRSRASARWLAVPVIAIVGTVLLLLRSGTTPHHASSSPAQTMAATVDPVRSAASTKERLSVAWPVHQAFLREGFDQPAGGGDTIFGSFGSRNDDSSSWIDGGRACIAFWGEKENAVRTYGIGSTKRPIGGYPMSVVVEVGAEHGFATSAQGGIAILDDDSRALAFATTTEDGLIRISSRREVTESFSLLYEGHAPSFVAGGPNTLSWVSSPAGTSVYVNEVLVRRVDLLRPPDEMSRVGIIAIGRGRSCFDDVVIYRPGQIPDARPTPALASDRGTSTAWRLLESAYDEFFHLPGGVQRDPDSGLAKYGTLWRINSVGDPWSHDLIDGAYCFTNDSKRGSVDWVSLRSEDPSVEMSHLPLTTEVRVEPRGSGSDAAAGGLIVHLHTEPTKSYLLYSIDARGTVRLQRRTADGFGLLYAAPARPFNAGGYNTLGIHALPEGHALYVNDVFQELVLHDAEGPPSGGAAGPAAYGLGRFCFDNFVAFRADSRATSPVR